MRKHARTRKAVWLVALSFAFSVLVALPANAATMNASLTPDTATAGASTPFNLTVQASGGQLRSLSLAAPAGFYVASASSNRGNATVSGNATVNVSGVNISGSQTVTVTITAFPKCTTGLTGNTWTLSGTGNGSTTFANVTLGPTAVANPSACKLLFGAIDDLQTGLTGTATVSAVRANNTVDTTYSDAISLSIENDPGEDDATLSGGGATTPTDGQASFSISLDEAGTGYVLEACSPTINGGACDALTGNGGKFLSNLFAVYDDVQPCDSGNSCTAHASAPGQVDSTVSAPNQSGVKIKAGAYSVTPGTGLLSDLDCAGYDEITEVITTFDYTSDVGIKTVVNTVSAEQMKEIANQGVSFLQVCFGSSLPFTDRFGVLQNVKDPTLGLYVGLLPDCPANKKRLAASAPCVVSRQGGGTGTGTITFVAADGDPGGSRH